MRVTKRMMRYFKNYRFNSLFFKNFYMLLLLTMVPITGAIIIGYYTYRNMQMKEIEAYCEKTVTEVTADLSRILEEARTELLYFSINSSVELYIYDGDLNQNAYKLYTIQELIKMPIIIKDYVKSVYIYSDNSKYVVSVHGALKYEDFAYQSIFDEYLKYEGKERYLITESDAVRYLSVFQNIDYGREMKGIAVMNMDINRLLAEIDAPEGTEIFVANDGKILIAQDVLWLNTKSENIDGYDPEKAVVIGEKYSVASKVDLESGLEIIIKLDMQNHYVQMKGVLFIILLILGIIIWATLGFAFFASIKLFQPIEKIIDSMKQNEFMMDGEKEPLLEKDELEYILKTIQKKMKERKNVEEELAQRISLLKKAQSVALQTQITPHFLNNTLETMNWMAIESLGGKNEISQMAGTLSKMLRISLESTDIISTVRSEIEYCKYYLEIQKKRYEDKFEVVWEIEPEIYEYKIIRIVLQPLIENAIYHGMKPLSARGTIRISGKHQENYVVLTVSDNGLGMTETELESVRKSLEMEEIREGKHIGLSNVDKRLKLYFGEEYGLQIDSREGRGTDVRICIPKLV